MPERPFRTEEEYFAAVNKLLKSATPVGAYCLAFAEVLRREDESAHDCRELPPPQLLDLFVACQTVKAGLELAQIIRLGRDAFPSVRWGVVL